MISEELEDVQARVKEMMERFLINSKGTRQVVRNWPNQLRLTNQKPTTSDPHGKRKLETGRETITLYIQLVNKSTLVLARLHEEDDGSTRFEDVALANHLNMLPSTF